MKRKFAVIALALVMLLSGCGNRPESNLAIREDLEKLEIEIAALAEWANEKNAHQPLPIHATMMDIDCDGIPELFYGYRIISARADYHRIYSFTQHDYIEVKHIGNWQMYYEDDEGCAVITGENSFGDVYYLDEDLVMYYLAVRGTEICRLWHDGKEWCAELLDMAENEGLSEKPYQSHAVHAELDTENIEGDLLDLFYRYINE